MTIELVESVKSRGLILLYLNQYTVSVYLGFEDGPVLLLFPSRFTSGHAKLSQLSILKPL